MPPSFEEPKCTALTLCQGTQTPKLGFVTLHGAFAGFISAKVPMVLETLGVFAVFTNVRSRARLTSHLTYEPGGHLEPIELIEPIVAELITVGPLQRTPWAINIPNVTLPGYGEYVFRIRAGATIIGEQRFALSKDGRA